MDKIKEIFGKEINNLKVSGNFENSVFSKIRKKKAIRKKLYSGFVIVIMLIMFFGIPVLKHNKLVFSLKNEIKEKNIPIIENMNFASSDNTNNYAIEIITKDKKQRRPL